MPPISGANADSGGSTPPAPARNRRKKMKQNPTIEELVSGAVQQSPLGTFTIDGREYTVDRPRVRTLIIVSELISRLPGVNAGANSTAEKITEALRVAKDCAVLGEIAAVLILGAKHLTEERKVTEKALFGLVKREKTVIVDVRKELAEKLLLELSCDELKELIEECLVHLRVPGFFSLITSLYEVNLLKPTGEVKTTQSGQ